MASRNASSWTGFMIMAFALVGLLGGFATYAVLLPFDRLQLRDDALGRAAAAMATPNPRPTLDALRPVLGDMVDTLPTNQAALAARIATLRQQALTDLHAQAQDYAFRLRVILAIFTSAACLFGGMIVSVLSRS